MVYTVYLWCNRVYIWCNRVYLWCIRYIYGVIGYIYGVVGCIHGDIGLRGLAGNKYQKFLYHTRLPVTLKCCLHRVSMVLWGKVRLRPINIKNFYTIDVRP